MTREGILREKKKTELRNKGKIIRMSYKRNINTNLAS